jgi:phosphatidylglycerophosphate synthase
VLRNAVLMGTPAKTHAADIMSTHTSNLTVPNVLSGLRIASIPLLLLLAWKGEARLYIVCLGISLSTDLFDGLLARLLNQRTELGAKLDQWADAGVLLSLPLAIRWLWPDILHSERWFLGVAVVGYAGSASFAWWKFGRPATYHSWLGKTATLALSVGAFTMMLGWGLWFFRAGVVVMTVAVLEEFAISLVLKEPRVNVPSWWHARRMTAIAGQPTEHPQGEGTRAENAPFI